MPQIQELVDNGALRWERLVIFTGKEARVKSRLAEGAMITAARLVPGAYVTNIKVYTADSAVGQQDDTQIAVGVTYIDLDKLPAGWSLTRDPS